MLYSLIEWDLGQKGYPKFSTQNKAVACVSGHWHEIQSMVLAAAS